MTDSQPTVGGSLTWFDHNDVYDIYHNRVGAFGEKTIKLDDVVDTNKAQKWIDGFKAKVNGQVQGLAIQVKDFS